MCLYVFPSTKIITRSIWLVGRVENQKRATRWQQSERRLSKPSTDENIIFFIFRLYLFFKICFISFKTLVKSTAFVVFIPKNGHTVAVVRASPKLDDYKQKISSSFLGIHIGISIGIGISISFHNFCQARGIFRNFFKSGFLK